MILDIEKYLPYMDKFDLPHDKKIEIIKTVWGMMESQVDQAFGVHPVQQAGGYVDEVYLHPQLQSIDSKIITVASKFEHASKEAANDNGCEPERKAG